MDFTIERLKYGLYVVIIAVIFLTAKPVDAFKVETIPEITVDYDETKVFFVEFYFKVDPWPPRCCKPNSTDWDSDKDVTVQFFSETSNKLLCETQYKMGEWQNETLTRGCSAMSGGRIRDYEPVIIAPTMVLFTMNNVTIWDTGTYKVVIINTFKEEFPASTNLVINVKPRPILKLSVDPTQDRNIGDVVEFNCSIRNTWPEPHLNWTWGRYNDIQATKVIATTWQGVSWASFSWTLRKVDHGTSFICHAWNKLIEHKKATTSQALRVRFQPTVIINKCEAGKNFPVLEKTKAVLISAIKAYPTQSEIKWLRPDGTKIEGSNKTRLELHSITRGASGDYTCQARNALGLGSNKCFVDVQYGPTIHIPKSKTKKKKVPTATLR